MNVFTPIPITPSSDVMSSNLNSANVGYLFDGNTTTQAVSGSGTMTVTLKPSAAWDSIAVFGVTASTLTIELADGPTYSASRDMSAPAWGYLPGKPKAALIDLPLIDPADYPSATVTITLTHTNTIRCHSILIGKRFNIGTCLYPVSLGITDYSRKERDSFGNLTLIERGFSDIVDYSIYVDTANLNGIKTTLAALRATPAVYVGHPLSSSLIVYGLYKDLSFPLESLNHSKITLSVTAIAQPTLLYEPLSAYLTNTSEYFMTTAGQIYYV